MYNSITNIKDEFVEEAQTVKVKRRSRNWVRWAAIAACLCLAAAALLRPKGGGTPSGAVLTDVLGFDVCRVEVEEISPYQYEWHYYVEVDGEDVCVAEQFGYNGPEAWSRDLDGDGVPELICNSTYGDGAQRVIVYRSSNGVIEAGWIRWSYYDEKSGWTNVGEGGVPSMPSERYDPERGVFTVTGYSCDAPVTVEFDDGAEPFDFFPFKHLP